MGIKPLNDGGGGNDHSGRLIRITGDPVAVDETLQTSGSLDNLVLDLPTNAFGTSEPDWIELTAGFTNRVTLAPGTYIVAMDCGLTVIGYTFTGEEATYFPTGTGSGGTQPFFMPTELTTEIHGLDPEGWSTQRIVSIPEGSTTRNKLKFNMNLSAPLNTPYPAGGELFATITIVPIGTTGEIAV